MACAFDYNHRVFLRQLIKTAYYPLLERGDIRILNEFCSKAFFDGDGTHIGREVFKAKGLVSKHSVLVNVVTFILDITLADRLEVAGIIALFSQMLNHTNCI